MLEWLVNDELEKAWKESVVAQSVVLSWHLHGQAEENHGKFQ
jgi:hypothetical protein